MSRKSKIASLAVSIVISVAGLVASAPLANAGVVGYDNWPGGSCGYSKYYYSEAKFAGSGGVHVGHLAQTWSGLTRNQTSFNVTAKAVRHYWGWGYHQITLSEGFIEANSWSFSAKGGYCS